MAIDVSMDGSGEIGEIQPGWSVEENATPIVIGESSKGVGSVSLSAGEKETSSLIINNLATTSQDDLGSISGYIKNASVQGGRVSFSHTTILDKFNAEKNVPALVSGDAHSALDISSQLIGENRLRPDLPGWIGTLAGHDSLFDSSGNVVYGGSYYSDYKYYDPITGTFQEFRIESASDSVQTTAHYFMDGKMYARDVSGDSFQPDQSIANVNYVAYRTFLADSTASQFYFSASPFEPDFDYGFYGYVVANADANTFRVQFDSYSGGSPVETIDSQTMTGFTFDKEYIIFIKYSFDLSETEFGINKYHLTASIAPADDVTNFISASVSIEKFFKPGWYDKWGINGPARSIWRSSEFIPGGDAETTRGNLLRTNLMPNPSFENPISGWSATASTSTGTPVSVSAIQSSLQFYSGSKSLLVLPAGSSRNLTVYKNNFTSNPGENILLLANTTYTFSFKYKFNSSLNNIDGTASISTNVGSGSKTYNPGYEFTMTNSTTSWQSAEFSFTTGEAEEAVREIRFSLFSGSNTGMTFHIDAVQIEKSETATPYFDASIISPGFIREFETVNGGLVSNEYESLNIFSERVPFVYDIESNFVDTIQRENFPALAENSYPAIGFLGSLWDYLQAACAAYGQEMAVVNNVIVLRDLGVNVMPIDNVVASPTVSVQSTLAGRSVDITYTNAESFFEASGISKTGLDNPEVAYDARDDDNKVISVKPGEVVKVSVSSDSYPTSIYKPERFFELPNAPGCYIVSDADSLPFPTKGTIVLNITAISGSGTVVTVTTKENHGLTVDDQVSIYNVSPSAYNGTNLVETTPSAKQFTFSSPATGTMTKKGKVKYVTKSTIWEDYGGDVDVAINPDTPGLIDVTVTGPYVEIPGYKSPYRLAAVSDSTEYATLSIIGRGIKARPKTLSLKTGVSHKIVNTEVYKTINNPFIAKLEQAYDRGIYSSIDASGPRVTISGEIPTSSIDGFGLTAGSVFEYKNSKYRVSDVSISNIGVSFNASRFVNVDEFNDRWDGKTVRYHDGIWDGFEIQDQIIIPFYGLDITNGSVRFDVDGNPYFQKLISGEENNGEVAILLDTDGEPYYVPVDESNEPTLLELDTDFTPYYS